MNTGIHWNGQKDLFMSQAECDEYDEQMAFFERPTDYQLFLHICRNIYQYNREMYGGYYDRNTKLFRGSEYNELKNELYINMDPYWNEVDFEECFNYLKEHLPQSEAWQSRIGYTYGIFDNEDCCFIIKLNTPQRKRGFFIFHF